MPAALLMGIGTAISAGSAISGAVGSRKAAKNQKQAFAAAEKGGAFDPLVIAKPQRLKVPSVGGIMGQYRQDVAQNYGGYEEIAQRFSASEQASNRAATQAANPNYYNILQQLSNTAMQAGKGMLPADVRQQILQNANEDAYLKGFSYGKSGGGGNVYAGGNDVAANIALQNLGLSSLDMMKYGNALGQDVLTQTRASRGRVTSAMDVAPQPALFQQQMGNAAIADYNYRTDQATYRAGMQNAPQQAALNKLTFQTGAQTNQAAIGQSSNRMALESLTALGNLYGNTANMGSQAGGESLFGGLTSKVKNLFGNQDYMSGFGSDPYSFSEYTPRNLSSRPTSRGGY